MDWISSPFTDHDGDGCRDLTEDFDDDEDGIFDYYDIAQKDLLAGSQLWKTTRIKMVVKTSILMEMAMDQLDKCPSIIDDQADLDGDELVMLVKMTQMVTESTTSRIVRSTALVG